MFSDGYNPDFLGQKYQVAFPVFPQNAIEGFARLKDVNHFILPYGHYSAIMHKERGFPTLSVCNISGSEFKKINRKDLFGGNSDQWDIDERLVDYPQWGLDLYRADKSDFDRGHLTKREDVQWGSLEEARNAALSTFFYTNEVPQRKEVNQSIWRQIEDYMLKKETLVKNLKICVFTAPVLQEDDPLFVTG